MEASRRNRFCKIVSMFLVAAIVITAPTMFVFAEAEKSADASPANPVHCCTQKNDGTDTTDWSYVYFGSYPQSRVWDTSSLKEADFDANGDAWVDGTKYRRIGKSTEYVDNYKYFKWEPIKWRVLRNDGETLFVMADQALDYKGYHYTYTSVTWETCSLRDWLNNDFLEAAFSSEEQDAVVEQELENRGADGGNNTMDRVFLLSYSNVVNPEYGFCANRKTASVSRHLTGSDYFLAVGGADNPTYSPQYRGNCWWWLRAIGGYSSEVVRVHSFGYVDSEGMKVTGIGGSLGAVAPVLHIDLSSELWSLYPYLADSITVTAEDGKTMLEEKECVKLTALIKPKGKTNPNVRWSSSDEEIASVNKQGEVTAISPGRVAITAEAEDGSGTKGTLEFTVIPLKIPIKKIKLNAAGGRINLNLKEHVKLVVDIMPKDATEKAIIFRSSNNNVATVNVNGEVTAKNFGSAFISAEAKDDNGIRDGVWVYVSRPLKDPALNQVQNTEPKIGDKLRSDSISYKITSSTQAAKTVSYLKTEKGAVRKVIIPSSVEMKGYKYTVTEIAPNTFRNNKKLQIVTIGANIEKIGRSAFENCKRLKKIVIKSAKIKIIDKKAFKGISKNAVITVPKKNYKAYRKLFKKAGLPKSVKIKKK